MNAAIEQKMNEIRNIKFTDFDPTPTPKAANALRVYAELLKVLNILSDYEGENFEKVRWSYTTELTKYNFSTFVNNKVDRMVFYQPGIGWFVHRGEEKIMLNELNEHMSSILTDSMMEALNTNMHLLCDSRGDLELPHLQAHAVKKFHELNDLLEKEMTRIAAEQFRSQVGDQFKWSVANFVVRFNLLTSCSFRHTENLGMAIVHCSPGKEPEFSVVGECNPIKVLTKSDEILQSERGPEYARLLQMADFLAHTKTDEFKYYQEIVNYKLDDKIHLAHERGIEGVYEHLQGYIDLLE